MLKSEKETMIKGLEDLLRDARGIVLADFQGMTVARISELRKRCREADIQFRVAKNTLLRRAADATGHSAMLPHIKGPTAVATSATDEVAPARVLVGFFGEFQSPVIRGGFVSGKAYDDAQVKALSKLPPKEVILSSLVYALQSPVTQFASVLIAPVRDLARVLDQVAKQKETAA
jgi:large subunit ribosomal protein L10